MVARVPAQFVGTDTASTFDKNFLKVSVFYEDLNYESIVESPAYDVIS